MPLSFTNLRRYSRAVTFTGWCVLSGLGVVACSQPDGTAGLDTDGAAPLTSQDNMSPNNKKLASGEEIVFASIDALQAAMATGEITSLDLVEAYLAQIESLDQQGPRLNAIAHVAQDAREQAMLLDAEREQNGPRSRLHGIVVVIKDNYETVGLPTTAGSAAFMRMPTDTDKVGAYAPPRDAELVRRLRDAGAVILAKTTMHEFAYGITTQGSGFGQARNAYDPTRNPGGSSGGTGAAVAAGMATVGMGSDTCGSIRIPAAQNNLIGLRGTQGLSSRRGIIPLSSTQDIGGPLARSVRDLSSVLDATIGFDDADAQTHVMRLREPPEYLANLGVIEGARIGLLVDWLIQDPDDQTVAKVIQHALQSMRSLAAWHVDELGSMQVNASLNDRPWSGHAVLIRDFAFDMNAYLASNPEIGIEDLAALNRLGLHHPSIAASMSASLELAKPEHAEVYAQEIQQREVVRTALITLLDDNDLDALVYPTIRRVAAPLGEEQEGTNCRLSAISGLPALSVPAGFTAEGLPVGLELLGRDFDEQTLLNLGYSVEQLFSTRRNPAYQVSSK